MRKSKKIFSLLLVLMLLLMTGMSSVFATDACVTCGGDGQIVNCDGITCDCPDCYYYDETAWGRFCDGSALDFPGSNWATYFTFNVNTGNPVSYALYAGQHDHVGFVNIYRAGSNLSVEVHIFHEYHHLAVTEVHIMAVDNPASFPMKNGNPIPGKFTVNEGGANPHLVPYNDANKDGIVYVAVHAVVEGWICE